ncbi:glycosyltransferase family 2 protein [Aquilutibacter rugosus]|uniref:glycosyltransferase family 2 protein n=1 Tax=Aquilutibacter rugosus TaxID=3115820 RepID=UPI002F40C8B7
MTIKILAINQLEKLRDIDAYSCYRATGTDPQFEFELRSDFSKGGWFHLQMYLDAIQGSVSSPCLYPDYGDGFSESTKIPIAEPNEDGISNTIFPLLPGLQRLRFDPSDRTLTVKVGDPSLVAVSRWTAFRQMSETIVEWHALTSPEEHGRLHQTYIRNALGSFVTKGIRTTGSKVYSDYVSALRAGGKSYDAWVRKYDDPKLLDFSAIRKDIDALKHTPKISVLIPVYNSPEKWLRMCIESVLGQIYGNWELCIADDNSTSPHIKRVLEEYRQRDSRIKVIYRTSNGHISKCSNSALELATGDFVALLDNDDELPPDALYEIAKAVNAHPEWKLIFSDEDKIDENGRRYDPYFKSDWNYDLFLSHNCISHLGVYLTELIRSLGGFAVGMEGSQDWDLALRCVEKLKPAEIGHIPRILYHWRAIPGSTALAPGEKNYAHFAAMRAIQGHLDRIGSTGVVSDLEGFSGNYRVTYAVPTPAPTVSIIIPTRDGYELLKQCVESVLARTDYSKYEIIIVDNQSKDPEALRYMREMSEKGVVRVIDFDEPFNYSRLNNFAAAKIDSDILVLMNNDIEVISPTWLSEMVSQACQPGVGAVGAKLYYPDDTIQHGGVILGFNGVGVHAYAGCPKEWLGPLLRAKLKQRLSAVTAACLAVPRLKFEEVGGFDEALTVAYNDVDLCLKLDAAGYRNVFTPYAELYHHESATRGSDESGAKSQRLASETEQMMSRWGDKIRYDPYYNVNYSTTGATFDLAFPPRDPYAAEMAH